MKERLLNLLNKLSGKTMTMDELVNCYEMTYHTWVQIEHVSYFERVLRELGIKRVDGKYHF